jgi:hypothetical protein
MHSTICMIQIFGVGARGYSVREASRLSGAEPPSVHVRESREVRGAEGRASVQAVSKGRDKSLAQTTAATIGDGGMDVCADFARQCSPMCVGIHR